jgi:hypothetical protein
MSPWDSDPALVVGVVLVLMLLISLFVVLVRPL